jgi:hypothetical protein
MPEHCIADNLENRVYYSPAVVFTNDRNIIVEKTLLDIFLKIKLNKFEVNRNPEKWINAKNELGSQLFKNDDDLKDLAFYKTWFGGSFLLNVALFSVVFVLSKK